MLSRNIVLGNTSFWFMCYSKKKVFIFKEIVVPATLERYSMNGEWTFKRIAKFPPKEALPASLAQSCACPLYGVLSNVQVTSPLGGSPDSLFRWVVLFAQLHFSNKHGRPCILQVQRVLERTHLHCLLFTRHDRVPQGAAQPTKLPGCHLFLSHPFVRIKETACLFPPLQRQTPTTQPVWGMPCITCI